MASKNRSTEEKKEIYKRWCELINMTEEELKAWSKNPDRLKASLNRARAKANGGIQSGLDSLHRIKRRYSKPQSEWTAKDYDNASQENSFNSRMLGNDPGKVVSGTAMSKWEISLRNWGHNPAKKSSPAHDKWSKWKESNKEEIKESRKKTASETHTEMIQDITNTYLWEKMTFNNYLKKASEVLSMDIETGTSTEEFAAANDIVYDILKNPHSKPKEIEMAKLWDEIAYNETSSVEEDKKDADFLFLLCQILLKNKFRNIQHHFGPEIQAVQSHINNLLTEGSFEGAFNILKELYHKPIMRPYTGGPLSTMPDYGSQSRVATKKIIRNIKDIIEK